jgi:transcriptional regulator of acetoin/glycerol metabolism
MSASDDGRYSWIPLAQLQNFIKHGVIVTRVESSGPRSASFNLRSPPKVIPQGQTTLEDATRDHTLQTLQETKWVGGERKGAAVRLGLARPTLIAKMRRLGIESAPGEMLVGSSNRQALRATA